MMPVKHLMHAAKPRTHGACMPKQSPNRPHLNSELARCSQQWTEIEMEA